MITQIINIRLHKFSGLLLISLLITAFSINGQSFFSMRGFGEQLLYTDAYSSSLGGLVSLGRENPAFPMVLEKTSFYASVTPDFVIGQENRASRIIYDIRPISVDGKIPLPYGFRAGLKLSEQFNQNFNIYSDSTQFSNYWIRRHIIGQGGIYRLAGGVGKSFFNRKLTLGFEYSKLLGQSMERWYFEVMNGNYITQDTINTNYSGNSIRFGAITNISFVTIGLSAENILPGRINSNIISHGTIVDSVRGLKYTAPYNVGLGIVIDKLSRTKLFLDLYYENWSSIKLADTLVSGFKNSLKYSIGAEHWLNDNYPLRIGFRYYQTYLEDHYGKQVYEYALTGGSSVKIPKFGFFDYSLEIIRRQGRGLKETIGRINFSISFDEAWKKRTRRWGNY
jgi:hypothetical protein